MHHSMIRVKGQPDINHPQAKAAARLEKFSPERNAL